jgi:hypothetical protein
MSKGQFESAETGRLLTFVPRKRLGSLDSLRLFRQCLASPRNRRQPAVEPSATGRFRDQKKKAVHPEGEQPFFVSIGQDKSVTEYWYLLNPSE